MADAAKVLDISSNNNNIKKNDESTIEEKIKQRRSQELIIALCGAVGSGVKRLKDSLSEKLVNSGYQVEHIRLSDLIAEQQTNHSEIKSLKGFNRYKTLQDLGDKLRKDQNNSIIAEMAIRRINYTRYAKFGENTHENTKLVKTTQKVAYILDQLKNPEEVGLLRTTYRNNFYLIGLLRNIEERRKNLREETINENDINNLIERDRKFKDSFGQQVEDTLQLSDYFIRNIDLGEEINKSVSRFISLVHGTDHITPTRNEIGLYTAYSASLRSACLSRQVGSCIMDDEGNILSTGCNDVPSAGGGLYNAESIQDKRCYNKSGCYNDIHKKMLEDQIITILKQNNIEQAKKIANNIMKETKAKQIIEYSRAIHAEMDAILALARNTSTGTIGKTMYCTTYPCHSCARHIVASGIKKVVYIEPYEKSLARALHEDAICHTDSIEPGKVIFESFEGVSPNRYEKFFKYHSKRKNENGVTKNYRIIDSHHVDPSYLDTYFEYESKIVSGLNDKIGEEPERDFN
ncbi:deoxycytidylate deaminase [Kluyvera intermedia]|uniref:Deoxycytidylate deaminase n=1 Tax=Kluyvera intermedia TaxID=61648 RepID=A0ABX3ULJ0_KLUIN|nr:anti-phage dCTP deaminase [Kluyvera intermedia]ORJ52261.1 deoxycytidylate deaminase [Kluyvera intermedia]